MPHPGLRERSIAHPVLQMHSTAPSQGCHLSVATLVPAAFERFKLLIRFENESYFANNDLRFEPNRNGTLSEIGQPSRVDRYFDCRTANGFKFASLHYLSARCGSMWTNVRLPFEPCGHENGRMQKPQVCRNAGGRAVEAFSARRPCEDSPGRLPTRAVLDAPIADLPAGSTSRLPQ